MKKAKKFLSLLLAMAMVMAMSLTGFAKEADLSTHTFTAYQIFNADSIKDGELGNLTWGTGITEAGQAALLEAYGVSTVPALAKKLTNEAEAKAFAVAAYEYRTNGETVVSKSTVLDLGYYLIEDTTEELTGTDQAYNISILKVSDNQNAVEITNKTDVPSVDKDIMDPIAMDDNEAAIGEDVNYQITGTLPSNLADYNTYYMSFKDTLSKGLTYNDDMKVYLKNGEVETEVTDYFYINDSKDGDDTVIDVAIEDIKALDLVDGLTVDAQTKVVLKYSAEVNEDAVIAGTGNPNKVDLEYSNNPDQSGVPSDEPPSDEPDKPEPIKPDATGKTPESKVVTYVTELTIIKTDENGNVLTGAEFTLTGKNIHSIKVTTGEAFVEDTDGTYYKLKDGTYTTEAPKAEEKDEDGNVTVESNADLYVEPVDGVYTMYAKETFVETTGEAEADKSVSAFVDAEGKITFTGLGKGEYTIEETVVPEGYNKAQNISFEIKYENGTFTATNDKVILNNTEKPGTFETTIENKSGATLPETGGMGTRLFYLIGGLMVLCAGVLLVTKRRMVK